MKRKTRDVGDSKGGERDEKKELEVCTDHIPVEIKVVDDDNFDSSDEDDPCAASRELKNLSAMDMALVQLLIQRSDARKEKNYPVADRIREELCLTHAVEIDDRAQRWKATMRVLFDEFKEGFIHRAS